MRFRETPALFIQPHDHFPINRKSEKTRKIFAIERTHGILGIFGRFLTHFDPDLHIEAGVSGPAELP